jgi:ubiquinone/menaquinone biosynthesis C-methylase UbiE
MNNFFKENHNLVFQEWLDPNEIEGLSILDLGSQTGWLGPYCTEHKVKEYVGVDIDQLWIDRAKESYPDLTFICADLEDYVVDCIKENKLFDIIVISRTIEGVQNIVTVLQQLSKITNQIVFEVGVPINSVAYEALQFIQSLDLTEEQKLKLKHAWHYIEYKQPFIEYFDDDQKFIWAIPSIGLYDSVFSRLGFQLDLDTYERVKQKYPNEYGFFTKKDKSYGTADTHIGRAILKFKKVSNKQQPLTWKEWHDLENK